MSGSLNEPGSLTAEITPRFRDGVIVLPVGDEAVLFEEDRGMLHQLDVTGALVCSYFHDGFSVSHIADELADMFSADREVIERDVLEMVRSLGRLGLLEGVRGEVQEAEAHSKHPEAPA
jgi:hypothetical protein